VLEKIEQGSSSQITFVAQGRSSNRDVPLVEGRMNSREAAIRLI
jgi:hypothetical protein